MALTTEQWEERFEKLANLKYQMNIEYQKALKIAESLDKKFEAYKVKKEEAKASKIKK